MKNEVKPIGATIDKLTILGDIEIHFDDFYKLIESLGFELKDYQSKKYGYGYVFIHNTFGGYIEIARQKVSYDVQDLERRKHILWAKMKAIREGEVNPEGESLSELNERYEHILDVLSAVDERGHIKRLKDVRYELNPKYFDYHKEAKKAFVEVVKMLNFDTVSMSSIHIAIDYAVDINSLEITDVKSRKENIFKGIRKRIETIYYGKRSSRSHLIVYDKKIENEENGSIDQYEGMDYEYVTRFEARLKNNLARDFFESEFNPFEGLIISDNFESMVLADEELSDAEVGKLLLYFNHPDRLFKTSDSTRKRYQGKMKKYSSSYLNVAGDYKKEKSSLVGELKSWLEISDTEIISEVETK